MSLNLLPSQAKFQADKIKIQAKIKKYLIVVSSLWLVAVVIVFGYQLTVRNKLNKLMSNNKNLATNYAKESKQIFLSNRLKYQVKQIGEILNDRFEYSVPFRMVDTLFPENITVLNYQLTDKDVFNITGVVSGNKNVTILEEKQDQINKGKINGFSQAKLITLSTKSGLWNFTMEVEIKNGGK